MRTVTKKFDLYKFEELKEDIQKKVITKIGEEMEEDYCGFFLEKDLNYKAYQLLEEDFDIKDKNVNVRYDLSYCQGSGCCVEFSINIEDLNKKYKIFTSEEMKFIQDKGILNDIKIQNYGRYAHEYSFRIDYEDNFGVWNYEDIKEDYKISEEDFNSIEDRFIELVDTYKMHYTNSQFVKDVISLNTKITKYGYSCIEWCWEEDNIKEEIKCRNNDYLSNGEEFIC